MKFNIYIPEHIRESELCSGSRSGKKQHHYVPINCESIAGVENVRVEFGCKRCDFRTFAYLSKREFIPVQRYFEEVEKKG